MKPGPDAFGISVVQTDHAAVLRVIGKLDRATAPRLRKELLWLIDGGIRAMTMDLAHLDFIDSTGLSVLVMAMKRLREQGGDITIQSPQPTTVEILELSGLTTVFANSSQ